MLMSLSDCLSLNASVGASACKSFHFGYRHVVEVAWDGVLESRCSYGKLKCFALCRLGEESVDEAS